VLSSAKAGRARAIKEGPHAVCASAWWRRGRRFFVRWYARAILSRLEPVKRMARMIQRHLDGRPATGAEAASHRTHGRART
jgi:transposase